MGCFDLKLFEIICSPFLFSERVDFFGDQMCGWSAGIGIVGVCIHSQCLDHAPPQSKRPLLPEAIVSPPAHCQGTTVVCWAQNSAQIP